ncbi:PH domain-containing protein [Saccharopolyspora shandongensis]|uniref:Putative membrane protein n=1 Tax=Saccharopolyspora shandongensis TaxID=418495 RepID=A0A1H2URE3_9PSEU|nr:PH domain-containing protein [Saccharopolyspora shandongensis]SDW58548.1 putative membrane protein [Saccharopolyspora shandongensis]
MSSVIDGQWRRLDPKTVAAAAVLVMAPLVPTAGVMFLSDAEPTTLLVTALIWVGVAVLIAGFSAAEWWLTWYRITDERFELRHGVLTRNHRWIPRERIRSVDLTADPGHRLFRITTVKVGTGGQAGDSSELKLDAIARHHAESLRQELLFGGSSTSDTAAYREPVTMPSIAASAGAVSTAASTEVGEATLARLNPTWFRFSALTLSFMLIVWGAIASGIGSFKELLEAFGVFESLGQAVLATSLWLVIAVGAAIALVVGVLGAIALSVEMWWGFRLTRERGDTLRVKRGLLTTRSVSLEERRLRGVELAEPLLLRWARGARLHAVATGLNQKTEEHQPDNKTLLPPAPRAETHRVAAEVLRERESPFGGELHRHPRAALRRRITWALVSAVPFIAAAVTAAVIGWLSVAATAAVGVVAVAVAIGFALDAYRNLGHAITDRYLISRSGTGIRRTVALQREGIIGWRIRRTVFQRRSDLLTIGATTAAGNSVYEVRDVSTETGLRLAEEAVPGLLAPFLQRG